MLPLTLALALSLSTGAGPPPALLEAREKADNLDYAGALKALDRALEVEGLAREAVLDVYELKGICLAVLGKSDKAREAFRALLVLDPKRKLVGTQPPRVTSAFYEALGRAASEGTLELTHEIERSGSGYRALKVTLKLNPLRLVKKLKVYATVRGMPREVELEPSGESATARLEINASQFSWWASALGERDAELLLLASAQSPTVVEPPAPADAPVAVALDPKAAGGSAVSGSAMRVAGAVVGVAGVATLAVGLGLGAASADARRRVDEAPLDEDGSVVGMTQREAAVLDQQARDQATAANVLMIGGGLVAATGLLLVIFAPSDEVTVAPAPGGVVVSGRF